MKIKSLVTGTVAIGLGLMLSTTWVRPAAAEDISEADLATLAQSLEDLQQALLELQQLTNAPDAVVEAPIVNLDPTVMNPAPVNPAPQANPFQPNPFATPHFSGADAFNGGSAFSVFK